MKILPIGLVMLAMLGSAHAQKWSFEARGMVTRTSGFSTTLVQHTDEIALFFQIDESASPIQAPAFIPTSTPNLPQGMFFYPVIFSELDLPGSPPAQPQQSAHYVADNAKIAGIIPTLDLAGMSAWFVDGENGSFQVTVSAASFDEDFITETGARTIIWSQQKLQDASALPFIDIEVAAGSSTVFGDCQGIPAGNGTMLPCDVMILPLTFDAVPTP